MTPAPTWSLRRWVVAVLLVILVPASIALLAAHLWLIVTAIPYLHDTAPLTPAAHVPDTFEPTDYHMLREHRPTSKPKHKPKRSVHVRTIDP